ncbi:galactose mutarotase-like enzyme [Peteryoungia aggregata LMG 23059]|uniref:Galactose mutarotase-like enzyme n=1 Tax=Peteryoungia aggregata LMG 23059 TaxID=1368425 RepID=A0ABU0GB82_9HYPH|nr:aldose 1-epimerase family protein [Peteryoungia aggregata]MDQ0421885.1 galactose mutarotase-like enzyme [Peteryoungia aggregata LMG 23059]
MSETIRIANSELAVEISSLGAEMQSLQAADGRDFLWNGDAAWWTGRSPILFPIVGKAPGDVLAVNGTTYPMAQHGIARRREFAMVEQTETACRHELVSTPETRAVYPFDFRLTLEHRLEGRTLSVTATVENTGGKLLPFGIGFHPAFLWPLPGADGKQHSVILDNGAEPGVIQLEDGLIGKTLPTSPFKAGRLELAHTLFDNDALIFPEGAGTGLSFAADGGPSLHFTFENLPNIALWQKPGAPFLCVEPWHGMAAHAGGTAELVERPYTVALAAGDAMRFGFTVEIRG